MFHRILIANRGEIAVRIIRACREMNIETVAVYSTEDKNALHVQMATESVCIGSARAKDSYLNIPNILSAALLKGCEAIHPGYGFLAENSEFAKMVEDCGLVFIGPSPEIISKMGDKQTARDTMKMHKVPVIPGSEDCIKDVDEAVSLAEQIGYPVIIKASAGGGGKGMRKVYRSEEMKKEFLSAKQEALSAFGNDAIYMERLIEGAKHVEVQVLADSFGNVIHLGERDCSLQRKNQKMIEEAPCRALTQELREQMGQAAVNAANAVNYTSAGTIEFLLTKENEFFFMEMNTRVQVEHPVTEMVTGIDIIKEQIRIAFGLPISVRQEEVTIQGHAIECRINAEDPKNGFMPSCGRVNVVHIPGGNGVRIDSSLYQDSAMSPYYDSMLGKLVVHGKTRQEAVRKMRRALEEFVIEGISTNVGLLYFVMYERAFLKGTYTTDFLEGNLDRIQNLMEQI
ncbi:acetyl-CoA carboxylase biotin carboxylase subunit [Filifactor alocis]